MKARERWPTALRVAAVALSLATLATSAQAAILWKGGAAGWFDSVSNWEDGFGGPEVFPAAGDDVRIKNGGEVTFDPIGDGQPATLSIGEIQIGVNADAVPDGSGVHGTLNIVSGTLELTEFDDEAVRLAQQGKTGIVNQTGGTVHAINGGIRIGNGEGNTTVGELGRWTISGGSMIASGPDSNGRLLVGDKDGNAELNIIGTGPVEIVTLRRFEVERNGRLNYTLDANGVTPVTAGEAGAGDNPVFRTGPDDDGDPGAMLSVDFSAVNSASSIGDILLVNNLSDDPISGNFVNAPEKAILHTFADGSKYQVTYLFEAGGDGLTNDLALLAVPEPSSVLLLCLAGLATGIRQWRVRSGGGV